MATVLMGITGSEVISAESVSAQARSPKMRFLDENGNVVFVVPYAPKEVTYEGFVRTKTPTDRAVGAPLLLVAAGALRKMSFSFLVARKTIQQSVEDLLDQLAAMGANDGRYLVVYSARESGIIFKISNLSVQTQEHNLNNQISRATVAIEFTEDRQYGVTTKAAAAAMLEEATISTARLSGQNDRFYTMKSGDTLRKIAGQFYTSPSAWKQVALANGIVNPASVPVGTILVLP